MSILRQHRLASLLLVAVAMAAFSLSQLDFAMLFAACTLVTLSWYVTEGPRGRALPNWISNLFVLVVLAWSVFTFLATGELEGAIGSLGRFLLWLLVIRLFTQRSAHEDRERFALSTMLVVAGCLDSVQFFFGVLVIVYACLAVWTAMLWRISRSAETARAARRASDGFAPPLEIEVGRRTRPQFRWLAGSTILGILAASIVVFVLFPRFANLPGRGPRGGPSVTGFTDEIRLMGGGRISESRRELFTLRWRDPAGVLQESPRPLLLRGAVLDRYDPEDQRWYARRPRRPVRTLRTAGDGDFTPIGVRDTATPASAYTAEFEMRSLATDVMFTIYAPVGVRTDERRTLSLDPSTLLLRDVSTERVGRYWTYALKVDAQPSAEALESLAGGVEPASRGVGFPVAEVLPIAREILETVRRNSNIPEANPDDPASVWTANRETARAIASWMRANFRYTTDLSDFARIEGEDPIVTFLREEREGHCEFFASGLCAVLRSLGIESRVVTGYIALEYDDSAAGYIVRESNAHAWTEVRTGPNSWLAVDATPEETLLIMQQQNRSFADRFRWIYDRIEFLWNSRVVTYDSSTQATLADSMQGGWVDGAR
ncbi:MAG: transglutaminaseTgpA domain-containing protein [Phycisphaerales bacterium]